MSTLHRPIGFIAALLLAAGLALGGYLVGQGLERFRSADRSVTVKGLAEQDVEADYAVWTLAFRRAGNEFGAVQKALSGTVWNSGCRSWYQQDDGRNVAGWPWSTWRFWLETRKVRTERYHFAKAG